MYKPRGNVAKVWEYIQTRPDEILTPHNVCQGMGGEKHHDSVGHALLLLSGHMPKFTRVGWGKYSYTGPKREPKTTQPVEVVETVQVIPSDITRPMRRAISSLDTRVGELETQVRKMVGDLY
jgi:hypothetical protein